MSHKYFSYDSESGFDTFATAKEAQACARESIEWYSDNSSDGWDPDVESVVWGEIKQEAAQFGNRPVTENDRVDEGVTETCGYQLQSIDQKTGEFGGFNSRSEQFGDFMRVMHEIIFERDDIAFRVDIDEYKIMDLSIDYQNDIERWAAVRANEYDDTILDVYHYVALIIDKKRDKQLAMEDFFHNNMMLNL